MSKVNPEIIKEFYRIKQQLHELKAKEAELKRELCSMANGEHILEADGYQIKITDYLQFRLDKKALLEEYGQEFIDAYEKEVQCTKYEVKKV